VLQSLVDGRFEDWPITSKYIEQRIGSDWKPEFTKHPTNFEEASLAMMPRLVYEKFVKGYSEKQWGRAAASLDASLAGRFEVRSDGDPRLKQQRYQGLPTDGYATLMSNILSGIPVVLNFDYLTGRSAVQANTLLIFTGPIDEYFEFALGRLAYRGQLRTHEFRPDVYFTQPCGQVNNPDPANGPHIRTLEWKHMMPSEIAAQIRGSVCTQEVPFSPDDPNSFEYPFPDETNKALYHEYRALAETEPRVLFCGRLGEYRYYDMDQAIARAMTLAERILKAEERSMRALDIAAAADA
jgi:UDP-galactopyranose mutase